MEKAPLDRRDPTIRRAAPLLGGLLLGGWALAAAADPRRATTGWGGIPRRYDTSSGRIGRPIRPAGRRRGPSPSLPPRTLARSPCVGPASRRRGATSSASRPA